MVMIANRRRIGSKQGFLMLRSLRFKAGTVSQALHLRLRNPGPTHRTIGVVNILPNDPYLPGAKFCIIFIFHSP
jgi:hypothetical protein